MGSVLRFSLPRKWLTERRPEPLDFPSRCSRIRAHTQQSLSWGWISLFAVRLSSCALARASAPLLRCLMHSVGNTLSEHTGNNGVTGRGKRNYGSLANDFRAEPFHNLHTILY
jgi:hypothetical protein